MNTSIYGIETIKRLILISLFFLSTVFLNRAIGQWAEIHAPTLEGFTLFDAHEHGDMIVAVGYKADGQTNDFRSVILTSTDAGKTWNESYFGSIFYKSMHFINDQVGFIGGYGLSVGSYIMKTEDGGITWNTHFTDMNNSGISYITFLDENIGYASGYGSMQFFTPNLYQTTDGGETWNVKLSNAPEFTTFDQLSFFGAEAYALSSVYFNGSVLGQEMNYSADSGRTWIQILEHDQNIAGMAWLDVLHGFIITDEGSIQESTDGGVNWTQVHSTGGKALFSIFLNDSIGFVTGENGLMLKSSDQGQTWKKVDKETEKHLASIVVDGKSAFALGQDGIILKYGAKVDDPNDPGNDGTNPKDWPVGLGDPERSTAHIYPNPSQGILSVDLAGFLTDAPSLEIMDISGSVILRQSLHQTITLLDLSIYPKGMYIYVLRDGVEVVSTNKLILE